MNRWGLGRWVGMTLGRWAVKVSKAKKKRQKNKQKTRWGSREKIKFQKENLRSGLRKGGTTKVNLGWQRNREGMAQRILSVHHPRTFLVHFWVRVHYGPNKNDQTSDRYFWLVDHNDWFRWTISSPSHTLMCCPSFGFNGVGLKKN
jgi:hypothetical protein